MLAFQSKADHPRTQTLFGSYEVDCDSMTLIYTVQTWPWHCEDLTVYRSVSTHSKVNIRESERQIHIGLQTRLITLLRGIRRW